MTEDLASKTVPQLKETAQALGLEFSSKIKKQDLIELIKAAQNVTANKTPKSAGKKRAAAEEPEAEAPKKTPAGSNKKQKRDAGVEEDEDAPAAAVTAPKSTGKQTPATAGKKGGKAQQPEEAEEEPQAGPSGRKSAQKGKEQPGTTKKGAKGAAEAGEGEGEGAPQTGGKGKGKGGGKAGEVVMPETVGDELPADLLAAVAAHQKKQKQAAQATQKAKVVQKTKLSKKEEKKQFKQAVKQGAVQVGPVQLQMLDGEGRAPEAAAVPAKDFLKNRMANIKRSAAMIPKGVAQGGVAKGVSALSKTMKAAKNLPAANFAGQKQQKGGAKPGWR